MEPRVANRSKSDFVSPNHSSADPVSPNHPNDLVSLNRLPSSRYSTLLAYQVPQVNNILLRILPRAKHIVDATAHIGGDTLNFASIYPDAHITAIDIDPEAIEKLKTNITTSTFDVDRFTIVCDNCVTFLSTMDKNSMKCDMIYFDPPWGGPTYIEQRSLHLSLGSRPMEDIVNDILASRLTDKVLFKIPRNFAYVDFCQHVRGVTTLFPVKKPKRQNSVAYYLMLIQPNEKKSEHIDSDAASIDRKDELLMIDMRPDSNDPPNLTSINEITRQLDTSTTAG